MRDLLQVLAEPRRRRLLELLMQGEQSVSALVANFDISQSAVSQHLAVLAGAGLVQVRKEGRYRYYRLRREGLAELGEALDLFWTKELEDLVVPRPLQFKGVTMPVEKSVLVPLDADATFALLTEPERLRRWQTITARIELRAGGTYRWTIVPGHTASGNVLEVEPGKKIVLTWGWEDLMDPPPGTSTVVITLDPQDAGTLVTLVHEGLTDEQAAGHAMGWEHYLGRLATFARSNEVVPDEWGGALSPDDKLAVAESSLAVSQQVLRGIDASNGSSTTPCSEFTVDELIEHLTGSLTFLAGMAGAQVSSGPGTAEVRVADLGQVALESWRRRGIAGEVPTAHGTMPAALAANILSIELFIHSWDLASATGQAFVVSDELAAAVFELANELITPALRESAGFAAAVDVAPDAKTLDRLIAFTGRQLVAN